MIARHAPTRAESLALALTWTSFAIVAITGGLLPVLLVLILAVALTITIVFGIVEPRAKLASDSADNARKISSELGLPPNTSLRSATDAAALELARSKRIADDLRKLIGSLDQPTIATDGAGSVLLANPRAHELFGANGVGRAIEELCPFEGVLGIHAAAAGGRATRARVTFSTGGVKRTFEVSAVPMEVGDPVSKQPVVMTLADVSELANAAKSQTDFVANASHELRTPLASIRAAAETLEAAHDDPPMVARLGSMIRSNAGRLESLLTDMLELSRLSADEAPVTMEPIHIEALSSEMLDHFKSALAERDLDLTLERSEDFTEFRSELRSIRLILRNLVENAIKFSREKSPIVLRFTKTAPDRMRIEVIDQGVGIPLSSQSRIFERFFQVDEARTGGVNRRGTGLGLAMVKEAVLRLGGEISVDSVLQEGTTMRLELPYR